MIIEANINVIPINLLPPHSHHSLYERFGKSYAYP